MIDLVCPNCWSRLERKIKSWHCRSCLIDYPIYVVNDLNIIDFNLLDTLECECSRDGKTACKINLKKQLLNAVRSKKRAEKGRLSRIEQLIRDEVGETNRILDLGCAEGTYARWFTDKNECYGLEICPKRMLLNESNALDKRYKMLILGNCLNIPFSDGSFDIVICRELIEHIVETRRLAEEIHRVLKNAGKLILSTPNLVSLGNRLGIIFGKGLKFHFLGPLRGGFYPLTSWREGDISKKQCSFDSIRYPEQPLHVRFFTFESLRKFLEQSGFKVEKEIGIDFASTRIDSYLCKIFKSWTNDLFVVARAKRGQRCSQ